MSFRPALCLALTLALSGCATEAEKKKKEADKKEQPLKSQPLDPAFLAFLGRLRTAVAKRDLEMIASMMTADFGYRWDTPPVGDNVFTYWDLNSIWPELTRVLRDQFVPNGDYLVSPAAVVTQPGYHGYRAGMRMVNGGWKFAYFVPGEDTPTQ